MLPQFITSIIRPIVEIRSGERLKTTAMFFYFLLIIATIWMIKPVQKSLFIAEFGAKNIRLANIAEGIFLIIVVWAFIQLAKRFPKKYFFGGVLSTYMVFLVVFWFLFRFQVPFSSGMFWLFASSYNAAIPTLFFLLANDIFDPIQAKRLFGFILAGGSIGGILGGILNRYLLTWMQTEDLVLAIACIVGLCFFLVMGLWRHIALQDEKKHFSIDEKQNTKEEMSSARKILFASKYLLVLAGLVIIAKMTATVVDNLFGIIVENAYPLTDPRTAFFSGFFSWLNATSLVMQMIVTGILLRFLGVGISLWILPVGIAVLSVGTFIYPVLLMGMGIKLFDGSMNYSVQQANREILYIPIDRDQRYRVKPLIDMLGYRFSKTLAGSYIALFAVLFSIPDKSIGILIVVLIPFWVFLVVKMRKLYSGQLRMNLLNKKQYAKATETKKATDVWGFIYSEKAFEEIKSLMEHRSSYARKLAATAYLAYDRSGRDLEAARRMVDQILRHEALQKKKGEAIMSEKESEAEDVRFMEDLIFLEAKERIQKKRISCRISTALSG